MKYLWQIFHGGNAVWCATYKVVHFQCFICLDGEPFHYTGPCVGRRHDAADFHTSTMDPACSPQYFVGSMFPHHVMECVGGDAGYIGCAHCLTPFKAPLTAQQDNFNKWWKLPRSRVERWFAHLDRHRFMWFCNREYDTVSIMFRLMWNAEILLWRHEAHDCGWGTDCDHCMYLLHKLSQTLWYPD